MVKVDIAKWGQSEADLRRSSIEAKHHRTRERFLALYMVASGKKNASQWAREIGRRKQTVLEWIHSYNEKGPDSLVYQRTGGRKPTLSEAEKKKISKLLDESVPAEENLPGFAWTTKKLKQWISDKLGRQISQTSLKNWLKQAGFSWKKSKKVLSKANPDKRAEFVAQFQAWFEAMCQGELRLIYLDEVHLHQDMASGYRWSRTGKDDWVASHCPSLSQKINWYGAYDFSNGQCLIWHQDKCDSETTVAFLYYLAQTWPAQPGQETLVIWDGAPWHNRAAIVRQAAADLGFRLVQLPAYSPDLNPIEGLWKWMREEITQHHCYQYLYQLEYACLNFIKRINLDPQAIIRRLWPKFDLNPHYELVLFST